MCCQSCTVVNIFSFTSLFFFFNSSKMRYVYKGIVSIARGLFKQLWKEYSHVVHSVFYWKVWIFFMVIYKVGAACADRKRDFD